MIPIARRLLWKEKTRFFITSWRPKRRAIAKRPIFYNASFIIKTCQVKGALLYLMDIKTIKDYGNQAAKIVLSQKWIADYHPQDAATWF